MRKVHVKVVLDVFVVVDDDVKNLTDVVSGAVDLVSCDMFGVDVQDVTVESCEVTDSR